MSRIILHRALGSPPSRAVLMLCETIRLPVEIKEVNIIRGEHLTPEFTELNPMRTVPVIQDGDFILSESHAIMVYLLSKYGGDKLESLYPSDVRTRALVDQCMYFDTGVFFRAVLNTAAAAFRLGHTGPSERNVQDLESSYRVVEAYLRRRQYVAADQLTLADFSVGSTATAVQAIHKVEPNKFPRCADWLARLQEERVFKEVNAPGAAYFTKLLHRAWESNKKTK